MIARKNVKRGTVQIRGDPPYMWVEESLVKKKHKKLKFGERNMMKLKKVGKASIMSSHLTLIVAYFCSLEMF